MRLPALVFGLGALAITVAGGCAHTPATATDPTDANPSGGRTAAGVPGRADAPTVLVDPGRSLGDAAARVAIVEFADYQCPYCRAFHLQTFPRLRAAYIDTGKVRYFTMDYPLPRHAHAAGAAVAAYCAGAQGRYWEMHHGLYQAQSRLGDALYAELAAALGLDRDDFDACRASARARAALRRSINEARRLGVRGTPTFVLGRIEVKRVLVQRLATGAPAFDVFAQELDALLR